MRSCVNRFRSLERIESIAASEGRIVPVALRVNPSFSVKGSRLTMGGKPRQFGMDEQSVLQGKEQFESFSHVEIMGLHVYMGTRMLDVEPIVQNTRHILELADRIENEPGYHAAYGRCRRGIGRALP